MASKLPYRKVFRSRNKNSSKTLFRLALESIVFLSIGSYILIYLNFIPDKTFFYKGLDLLITNIVEGFKAIFSAVVTLGTGFLILSMMILGMILVLGGIWRILRILSIINNKSKTNIKKNNFYTK